MDEDEHAPEQELEHAMADKWHEEKAENDAMHQAAAEEGRDAEDGGDAIQLSVAT